MRRGERAAWDRVAVAARKVASSGNYPEEYTAKIELRQAWAKLNMVPGVIGIPRSGAAR